MISGVRDDAPRIGIAGTGRLAQALGRLLLQRGEHVTAIAGRDAARAQAAAGFIGGALAVVDPSGLARRATHLLVAVRDDAIEAVAQELAGGAGEPGVAVHTCGTRGPDALAPLAALGFSCAVFHPLQTVATPEQGVAALPRATFMIDGTGAAKEWAEHIVRVLDGQPLHIAPGGGPLYHAAAVMASNYLVGIIDAAVILLKEAGVAEREALRALAPLVRASCENALSLGPLKALTGPLERGDVETLRWHWRSLRGVPATVSGLYRSAAQHVIELASRKGLPAARTAELNSVLTPDDTNA